MRSPSEQKLLDFASGLDKKYPRYCEQREEEIGKLLQKYPEIPTYFSVDSFIDTLQHAEESREDLDFVIQSFIKTQRKRRNSRYYISSAIELPAEENSEEGSDN